ncbi:MAG TPA: PDZ domain-containing protein [Thermoanaerobaculia bacterium]|nr:PDZ domain-containing protein [Thermoanaerobaculia bacterium]
MRRLAFAVLLALSAHAAAAVPWLQSPAVSKDRVAFVYGGDLWTVGRDGGEARRLTTGEGLELDPFFSPDGAWIAFTGQSHGNFDVYLVPAAGGVPRRLTWHPEVDRVAGWTPDGRVLFRSPRNTPGNTSQLFTVPVTGGLPREVPLPKAEQGSFSPDGSRLAYVPFWNRGEDPTFSIAWKRYRGGLASPIWIARMSDSAVEPVPRTDSNDSDPMWIGDRVYFLSDRSGPATLFSYDPATRKIEKVLDNPGPDIVSASAGPGAIVYQRMGEIHLFDLASGKARKLDVRVSGDLPSVQPRWVGVTGAIQTASLSPTGVRAVFESRGEIVTIPAEKGDARNVTRTPGVAERDPAWSPDGQKIAFFSDESGEYALHVVDQTGLGDVKKIGLGDPPSFFYSPRWSPDGGRILYTDKRLNVWYVDLAKGKPVRVDTDTYEAPFRRLDPVWSPDGQWIAYTKQLANHMRAVFLYSLESGKARQVTDGLSDARFAAFDASGKYLYFTASTDVGPTSGWLDLSSVQRPVSRSVYLAVLDKSLPSPLAPLSDEEKDKKDAKDEKPEEKPVRVKVDFDGIDQRILGLPVPARNYTGLVAGKAGVIFLLEDAPVLGFGGEGSILHRFDLEKRETKEITKGVVPPFAVSEDGEKMLFRQARTWTIAATDGPLEPGKGALDLSKAQVRVDPRAEWKQMYREVWRIERDFFYDPGLHGLDLAAVTARYEPFLDDLGHRSELDSLFIDMLGELTVGHLFVVDEGEPGEEAVPGGLLGADYEIANGRYRFARILSGENWNPQLQAPLTQPGVNVKAGEYLLSVDGRELRADDDVDSFFEGTAGKSVLLEVGPDPSGKGSRKVSVVPVESEAELRTRAWIEGNRRKVDELSKGRLAYVYLPDTGEGGYTSFNRYFFAQVGKEGAILDERYNGGGYAADYFIDYLKRELLSYWSTREGDDFVTPVGAIFGPKVMMINERSASGGDALPFYFRREKLGPLVGRRTWGGLVGIYDYPVLLDGGYITAPRVAFWSPEGEWEVENRGVSPDVDVELDPKAWRQGRDSQLEKAVEVALEMLARNPPPKKPARPAYPTFARPASPEG